jgi:DNA invertase Pin-like site-specific DNA recombinase
MLKRTFDFRMAFRCVIYLRMSDEGQNKRSPDQQLAEIKLRIKRLKYP